MRTRVEHPKRAPLFLRHCAVVLIMAFWPGLDAAQLDDTCMVSALNRTAPVRPDGVWVLPNVPANQGFRRDPRRQLWP